MGGWWVCGWMGGCVGEWIAVWVDGWVSGSMGGSGQITNNLINLDIIEIILFEDL